MKKTLNTLLIVLDLFKKPPKDSHKTWIWIIIFPFVLMILVLTILVSIVESTVESIVSVFRLNSEETKTLEETKEGLMYYLPIEIALQENVTELGDYPIPVASKKYRITSGYGMRADPFTRYQSFHFGIDIVTNEPGGANIIAIADGVVVDSYLSISYGNVILIYHEQDGIYSLYAHLKERKAFSGQTVRKYQIIGVEGDTGEVTGRHLHFEIRTGEEKYYCENPESYLFYVVEEDVED